MAFPWQWPEIFREDGGYAAYFEARVRTDNIETTPTAATYKQPAAIRRNDETIPVQSKQQLDENEPNVRAEDRSLPRTALRIAETHEPANGEDSCRGVRKPEPVIREGSQAAVVSGAKERGAGHWTAEQMSELYKEIFGGDASPLEGMDSFELPLESQFGAMVTRSAAKKTESLFPSFIELWPIKLGWGRFKLALRFSSRVARDKANFPRQRSCLVWTWRILLKWKMKLLKDVTEPAVSMYDGVCWVVDQWTEQIANIQIELSAVSEAWNLDIQADMNGLDNEESKQHMYEAVFKVIASSRGQDDETRACGVLDWAEADPEKIGGGSRSRTYLALEAMSTSCAAEAGEEKLGMITQQMKSKKHVALLVLKKRAGDAAKADDAATK
ncbi:hypothetical protein N8I77_013539 [Diaporthe amygdali]|uniref:Uncharacterized protein n=1 Tax=Phomopsis amygdali TaxID=1214568 RepID=A0AAD9S0Y4_PHOAM|nr:hypothetical protein N8I77_013539 [Diaporthe amygdali]